MSPAKYAAGLALNAHENRIKILEEQIASVEAILATAKASLAMAHVHLIEQRAVLAQMRD